MGKVLIGEITSGTTDHSNGVTTPRMADLRDYSIDILCEIKQRRDKAIATMEFIAEWEELPAVTGKEKDIFGLVGKPAVVEYIDANKKKKVMPRSVSFLDNY